MVRTMDPGSQRWRSVVAATVGNVLAWYDFAVYIYFASLIARKFFPWQAESTSLPATFFALGITFIARPIGAVVLGRLADRLGRKPVLQAALFLIAGATFAIGFLPSYASIGVTATVLLVLSRLLQGIAAGGEWGISLAVMIEWAPERRRGLFGSLHQAGVLAGLMLAIGVVGFLNAVLTPVDLVDWGWRFPFVVGGGLTVAAGLWVRHAMEETPRFSRVRRPARPATANLRPAALAFGVTIVWAAGIYVLLNHMPVWTQRFLDIDRTAVLSVSAGALLVMVCLTPLVGHLSDRVGRKPLLLAAAAILIALPYPLLDWFQTSELSAALMLGALLVFVLPMAMLSGAAPTALAELFETSSRVGWMASAYAFAVAIFAAGGPYVSVWLIDRFQAAAVHGLYLTAAAIVSTGVILTLRETAFDELR